eukprot:3939347-Rhodomonas_salina.1
MRLRLGSSHGSQRTRYSGSRYLPASTTDPTLRTTIRSTTALLTRAAVGYAQDGAQLVVFEMEDDAEDVPTDPEVARQRIAAALGIDPERLRVAIPSEDDVADQHNAF